jgi:hypothetical protein
VLAYLILVHSSPRQLAKLVNALQGPDVQFFVHVDRKVEAGQFRYMLRRHRNVKFVRPRVIIEWGGWNMVQAELLMMRYALRAGATHLILLSGHDYPVWSNRRIKEYFLNTTNSHIEHYRMPSRFWDRGALNRIRQRWLCDDPIPIRSELWFRTFGRVWRAVWHRIIRKPGNLLLKIGYELGLRRQPPSQLAPYVGSQWWTMDRRSAEYVLEFVKTRPDVVRFFRHSHVPDESFIQTVLMNSPLADTVVNNNLRYLEWDGAFSPRVLDLGDLDAIVDSGAAFARKLVLTATPKQPSSEPLARALSERRKREQESDAAPRRPPREVEIVTEPPPRVRELSEALRER